MYSHRARRRQARLQLSWGLKVVDEMKAGLAETAEEMDKKMDVESQTANSTTSGASPTKAKEGSSTTAQASPTRSKGRSQGESPGYAAPSKRWSVAIAGASGYVGGELLRLLSGHDSFDVGLVTGDSSVGTSLRSHHRQLGKSHVISDRSLATTTPEALAEHDIIFLALPHGTAASIADQISKISPDAVIVDCSADHRLESDADWSAFYGDRPHAGAWVYGLPELPSARSQLKEATRIAVPGCYPTAVALAIAPALDADLVESEVVIVAASGTSGAGRTSDKTLTSAEIIGSARVYGADGRHRHIPEIRQCLQPLTDETVTVSFTPMLVPMSRGILATCSARARKRVSEQMVRSAYERVYRDEHFVELLPEGEWPTTAAVLGSNMAHVQALYDPGSQRVVTVVAIDNLTKGTAGNALQSLNLALGLPEAAGLPTIGVAP